MRYHWYINCNALRNVLQHQTVCSIQKTGKYVNAGKEYYITPNVLSDVGIMSGFVTQ